MRTVSIARSDGLWNSWWYPRVIEFGGLWWIVWFGWYVIIGAQP